MIPSQESLMIAILSLPLFQSLIQIILISLLPPPNLYGILTQVNRFFGLLALIILGFGIYQFTSHSEGTLSFKILSFHFALTSLGIFFWSAKTVMVFLVESFSTKYLFREPGIGKFYVVISLFSFSLNLVFLSDSFTPFTLGWELMGLCSVMLIAFFDHRRATVERSFLTFLFYKLGDFFLLTALLYMSNTTPIESFSDFRELTLFHGSSLILCLFALSAFVKSGLLPFSFWLPRSMEGPTPSSALFYGALSSHAGIFLLLRISLESGGFGALPSALIFVAGAMTALFSYLMALTRTDIKSQIIYSTLCQISVIFIEISLGWWSLALIHCLLHMFLRFFEFLIAPSAIYLSHEKDFLSSGGGPRKVNLMCQKLQTLIWRLGLHEFGLAIFWRQFALAPLLALGQSFKGVKRILLYWVTQFSSPVFRLRDPKRKDIARYIFFLMISALPLISQRTVTVSIVGVLICQLMALGFSLMTLQEKRLSTSFFNLIFSGTFLVVSYYYAMTSEHIHTFYVHLGISTLGFSVLGGLFVFFRNAFDLPDGHDFFGLHKISPPLSFITACLILFVLGFPGFSTYFSFELISSDLSRVSAVATITGLAILNINAYLWFNIYARLFWGKGDTHQIQLTEL